MHIVLSRCTVRVYTWTKQQRCFIFLKNLRIEITHESPLEFAFLKKKAGPGTSFRMNIFHSGNIYVILIYIRAIPSLWRPNPRVKYKT